MKGTTDCAGIGGALEWGALSGQLIWGKSPWFLAGGGGEKTHNLRRFDFG